MSLAEKFDWVMNYFKVSPPPPFYANEMLPLCSLLCCSLRVRYIRTVYEMISFAWNVCRCCALFLAFFTRYFVRIVIPYLLY